MSAPCEACLGRGHAVGSVLTPCKPCGASGGDKTVNTQVLR